MIIFNYGQAAEHCVHHIMMTQPPGSAIVVLDYAGKWVTLRASRAREAVAYYLLTRACMNKDSIAICKAYINPKIDTYIGLTGLCRLLAFSFACSSACALLP